MLNKNQVLTKNQDKEGKCWRGFWLRALCVTGEMFKSFPMVVTIFLRELDLAVRRPFCYGGLCSPRHCLLQQ